MVESTSRMAGKQLQFRGLTSTLAILACLTTLGNLNPASIACQTSNGQGSDQSSVHAASSNRSNESKSATIDASGERRVGQVSHVRRGQLESFNFGSTGLGDLEASDSLKKINKRSSSDRANTNTKNQAEYDDCDQNSSSPMKKWHKVKVVRAERQLSKRVDGRQQEFGANTEQNRQARLYPLRQVVGRSLVQPLVARPIVITRRTGELMEPPADSADEQQQFPILGEFGSRVSLLTTRKVQPRLFANDLGELVASSDELEVSQNNEAKNIGSHIFFTNPHHVDMDASLSIRDQPSLEETGSVESMLDVNPNYLPRIARAVM